MRKLSGQPRVRAWTDDNLLAIQIPSSTSSLDPADRKIVENKNPDYHRTRLVAAINAKDITKCEDLDDPSSNCLIKMSEVTVEGLRQTFLDPESRVRLNSDPLPEEHAELMSVAWEGGFLVLQRRFLNLVSSWPEIASRKASPQSCQSRG